MKNKNRVEASRKVAEGRLRVGGRFIPNAAEELLKNVMRGDRVDPQNFQKYINDNDDEFVTNLIKYNKTEAEHGDAVTLRKMDEFIRLGRKVTFNTKDGNKLTGVKALEYVTKLVTELKSDKDAYLVRFQHDYYYQTEMELFEDEIEIARSP